MTRSNDWTDSRQAEAACAGAPRSDGGLYEIRIAGQLDSRWSEWLGGLEMKLLANGEMILSGPIADQAALMGILTRLFGLNLALLSFRELEAERGEEP